MTIEQLEDGIYFDLPEEVHFAQERISKSDIKKIRVSAADWWAQSWLNAEPYPLTDSQIEARDKAKKIGRAYHCARLEPEKFAQAYVRDLEKSDFEGLLTSDADIKAQLKALELPQTVKGEDILTRAQRLIDAGYDGHIWHLERAFFDTENKGKEALPGMLWDQLHIDQALLRSQPTIDKLLRDGAAEVSILWTCEQTGLKMSTRLDYLRCDGWAEFKTFANPSDKELGQCLRDAIMYNGYYIDIVVQLQAIQAAVRDTLLCFDGEGQEAPQKSQELIYNLGNLPQEPVHHLIFQQKAGVPNILARSLDLWRLPVDAQLIEGSLDEEGRAELWAKRKVPSFVHQKALLEIEAAKRTYLQYSEVYERGEPWLPFDAIAVIDDQMYPPYWLEKEIE